MKTKIGFLKTICVLIISALVIVSCQKSTEPDENTDDNGNGGNTVTTKIIDIKSNGYDAVYLTNTGYVYSATLNVSSGTTTIVKSKVTGLQDIIKIACGPHSSGRGRGTALDKDGKIYTWEFDPNTAVASYVTLFPQMSTFTSKIVDIAVGGNDVYYTGGDVSFTYALDQDKKVWAWGDNTHYQLGNMVGYQPAPAIINGLPGDIIAISAGSRQGIALSSTGSVYNWGWISTNNSVKYSTPQPVSGAYPASLISAGDNYNLAKKNDGTVFAWGHLTDGNVPGITSPTVICAGAELYFNPMFIKSDGTLWKTSFSMATGNPNAAEIVPELSTYRFSLLSVTNKAFYITQEGKLFVQLSNGTTPLIMDNPL